MKKFLHKIILLICIVCSTYLLLGFLGDGYTDPFYLRFTSPKQKSLILGTSRAAQGIQPQVLNKLIKGDFDLPIYNYSFTMLHSPYGETYYNAIVEKLDEDTVNGLFIITVDPWSVSTRTIIDYPIETKKELGKLTYFNMYPNYDYLANAYRETVFKLLGKVFEKNKGAYRLHDDGWLEVDISMGKKVLMERTKKSVNGYRLENLPIYKISEERLNWLKKTVLKLEKHGKVIFIRMPVDFGILKSDNKLCKNFDSIIKTTYKHVPYLNYKQVGDQYTYIEGIHLYKDSGKKFSEKLAKDINNLF